MDMVIFNGLSGKRRGLTFKPKTIVRKIRQKKLRIVKIYVNF